MLTDTHPDAERVQIDLLRKMSGARKIALFRSHNAMILGLSRRGVARANPHLDEREANLLWVAYNYGKDIATGLRHYWESR
jgi:hypothetical protein